MVAQNSCSTRDVFERLLLATTQACQRHYGSRLSGLGVFGSVGRGTMHAGSDIDLLVVAEGLPDGRIARVSEFIAVEGSLQGELRIALDAGVNTRLSPVFKTPSELATGSPLMFDMVEDARILHDPQGVISVALESLRQRLAASGARRVWRGNHWYWDLKPDLQPGESFEI